MPHLFYVYVLIADPNQKHVLYILVQTCYSGDFLDEMKPDTEDIITDDVSIFAEEESLIFKDEFIVTIDYIPKTLIGRTTQVKKIADLINPIFRKGKPYSCLIYGKTGSGKTVVIKFVLNKLLKRISESEFDYNLVWMYIPCKQVKTTNDVLYTIITKLNTESTIPPKGYSLNTYYNILWKEITEQNTSIILVLDEIDQLKDDDILYQFSRAGEMGVIPERRFVSVFGISNDLNYIDNLDHRVKSSMNPTEIIFEPYDAVQIGLILKDRVPLAFCDGTVDDELISICAANSAKANGDARLAIDLIRTAGNIAVKEHCSIITPEHVATAEKLLAENRYLQLAKDLPTHDKLVLVAIIKLQDAKNVDVTTPIITGTYLQLCNVCDQTPLHRTTISTKISEFEMLGFIAIRKINKGRAGGVLRYIEFLKSVPVDLLANVLYDDYIINEVKDFVPDVYLLL